MSGSVVVPEPVWRAVVAHARAASPRECCGVLLGAGARIDEATAARNVSPHASRYEIDPADHIAARRTARRRGLQVVGFYHSHPLTGADPSPTDLSEATYTDHLYMIVGLADGDADVRLFRFDGRRFRELGIELRSEDAVRD